jgi:hypothetical protein
MAMSFGPGTYVRRITGGPRMMVVPSDAASLALTEWAAWEKRGKPFAQRTSKLYKEASEAAESSGWRSSKSVSVPGDSGHGWPTPLVLSRDTRSVAVLLATGKPESIVQRALGRALDTHTPSVVLVQPEVLNRVPDPIFLRERQIVLVPREAKGTAARIVEGANLLAPLAA